MDSKPNTLAWRTELATIDRDAVRRVCQATHFFRDDEVDIAVELVDEYLDQGVASGYKFVVADLDGRMAGYACFGEIACTIGSYDLYWVVVDPVHQGQGIGRELVTRVEQQVVTAGGRMIYIETSSRQQYATTRAFYERLGYTEAAQLADFYDVGDGKVIYFKRLIRNSGAQ